MSWFSSAAPKTQTSTQRAAAASAGRRSSGIEQRTGLPQPRCADVEAVYGTPHNYGDSTSDRHMALNKMWALPRQNSGIEQHTGLPQPRCADVEAVYGTPHNYGDSTSDRHMALNQMWAAAEPAPAPSEAETPTRRSSSIDPSDGAAHSQIPPDEIATAGRSLVLSAMGN